MADPSAGAAASRPPITEEDRRTLDAAARLVEDARRDGPDATAGLRDLQNQVAIIGMPAARVTLDLLIRNGSSAGADREALLARVAAIENIKVTGSLTVSFFDAAARRAEVAHLYLDACPRRHPLGEQLDRLQRRLPPDKWDGVLKLLSQLVFLGRSTYRTICEQRSDLIRDLCRFLPKTEPHHVSTLSVDPANTTMCVNSYWEQRVGIFVAFESEMPELAQNAAGGTASPAPT